MARPTFGMMLLPGDRKIQVDIREVPRKALSMLYRMEPRIVTKEFYDLDPAQRRIMITPRRMLEAYGSPHEAQQIYDTEILLPQTSANDPVFKLETYGSPRLEETWFKWLDASVREIENAVERRHADQVGVLSAMDRDIEDWLTGIGAMGEEAAADIVRLLPNSGTWGIDWNRVPFAEDKPSDIARRLRLRDRALGQGLSTVREYLMSHPETSGMARAIDQKLGVEPGRPAFKADH